MRSVIAILAVLVASAAAAGELSFARKPTATKSGEQVKIAFAVSAPTDVEVAVLDGTGTVARHLAAGLLGQNAPEPFQKDSLAQQLLWDGKDDAGQLAAGGPFKARVRIGLRPRLGKVLGRNDNTLSGSICALATNPQGELFVLLADPFRGRSELRVLDRQGKYLRTIMPYAADTPEARTEPVGHVKIDGRRQPLVFNGQGHCFYPLVAGLRGQSMAWHPDGYLLAASAIGSMCNHGPPRHLIAFHPGGGAPEKTGFVGPAIRKPRGFLGGAGEGYALGMDRLAVSPDGQWIYLVQDMRLAYFEKGERHHGVYRLRWTDKELGDPWIGGKEPSSGDQEFNDPQGLAVDGEGRLFICDRGNGRVKVYSPEGQLLGKFTAPDPEQIAVSPTRGEIYLLCRKAVRSYDLMNKSSEPVTSRVLKFAPWKGDSPQELARMEFEAKQRVAEFLALDASATPPRLWVSFYTGYERPCALVPVTDEGRTLKMGEAVGEPGGLRCPSFLAADPARHRLIVAEHGAGHTIIDLDSGQQTPFKLPGSDLTLDRDGNIYLMGGYNSNALLRFDPQGQPLPFPATGTNKLTFKFRAYGPNMGLRGHCIAPNGDLYVRRSPDHACVATVDVWSPDGTLKKQALINGAGSGDSGIGVDNRGNVYLGMNLKPVEEPIPADFANAVPAAAWGYYGNADSVGPGSKVPQPEIAFAWPAECDYAEADGRLYVSDSVNRRVLVVRFDAAAMEACDLR